MRFIVSVFLVLLAACGISPKDYSDAEKLKPIDTSLVVKPLWVTTTGDKPDYAHAQLSPTVAGNKVYITSSSGSVSAIDAQTSKLLWSHKIDKNISSGPGIGTGMVYVGTRKAEIIALSQENGAEKWRTIVSSEMLSLPQVNDSTLVIQTIDEKITALDVKSGKIIWNYSHAIPKLTLRGNAAPLISGRQVIAGFADGKLVSLNIKTGEVLWEITVSAPRGRTELERLSDIDGLFDSLNGIVYVSSFQGRIVAISIDDGQIQWARNMSSFSGLSVGEGSIIISDALGKIWAVDARTGATLWRQDNLAGREVTAPAIIDNYAVVADYDGYVHWLAMDDGQFVARNNLGELWKSNISVGYEYLYDELEEKVRHRSITIPPVVRNNILFVRDNYGAFAAFKIDADIP